MNESVKLVLKNSEQGYYIKSCMYYRSGKPYRGFAYKKYYINNFIDAVIDRWLKFFPNVPIYIEGVTKSELLKYFNDHIQNENYSRVFVKDQIDFINKIFVFQ